MPAKIRLWQRGCQRSLQFCVRKDFLLFSLHLHFNEFHNVYNGNKCNLCLLASPEVSEIQLAETQDDSGKVYLSLAVQ